MIKKHALFPKIFRKKIQKYKKATMASIFLNVFIMKIMYAEQQHSLKVWNVHLKHSVSASDLSHKQRGEPQDSVIIIIIITTIF